MAVMQYFECKLFFNLAKKVRNNKKEAGKKIKVVKEAKVLFLCNFGQIQSTQLLQTPWKKSSFPMALIGYNKFILEEQVLKILHYKVLMLFNFGVTHLKLLFYKV